MEKTSAPHERVAFEPMKAVRVHQFGGIETITYEDIPRPVPADGPVLVRVMAPGVGPWDAWVMAGKSAIPQAMPLILCSDLSGVVEGVGPGVSRFHPRDDIYGVTNSRFTGAYAQYAVAQATMIAHKPRRLNYIEAASVPVVASTAWQMVFDHGQADRTKRVLVHGAAGNVGAYAVQLAKRAGAKIIGTAFSRDADYVRTLGADQIIEVQTARFENQVREVDVVIDTIGGETLDDSFEVLKPGGVLVSSVALPDQEKAAHHRVRGGVLPRRRHIRRSDQDCRSARFWPTCGECRRGAADCRSALSARDAAGKTHRRGKIVLVVDA